ncbi:SAM-dependent methyltransferase [Sphingomonas sp. XMGL2]|uniref:SAM-dependent methyltransferase n=1 Tax=Sphingomonas quercus TaxID=2842451 RepID=A0ABS6BJ10_9SPHN|nr:SAM-dependent methyltransferase [Sphingomonas quercus]MBU3078303.1 SAM-dependent methyltransferase [Sphingomonas quercus]
MAAANATYYAERDPLGAAGDFITAPEISQMFGELIGLCLADLWARSGAPADVAWVELGPGRGTLSHDALRAAGRAGLAPPVHLVETSPALRAAQARLLPGARWHEAAAGLPADRPLLVVANEFFDALPVRQLVREGAAWRERLVDWRDGRFVAVAGTAVAEKGLPEAEDGAILEANPAALAIVTELAGRIVARGGAMLMVDYGHDRTSIGDTLQAVSRHAHADPFAAPGTRDLTAHVDFAALAAAAAAAGARTHGPVEQGAFLTALGLAQRAAALARAAPARGDEIAAAYRRLADPAEMGRLFKVLAVSAPSWPQPAGF